MFEPYANGKPRIWDLVDFISLQDWDHLFEWPVPTLHELEVHQFYYNLEI